jgi:hypothetical protein
MIKNKAEAALTAFKIINELPEKNKRKKFRSRNSAIMRFYSGLEKFTENTVRKALNCFRAEFEEGQAQKKRAVIQLI